MVRDSANLAQIHHCLFQGSVPSLACGIQSAESRQMNITGILAKISME